jgi:molybdopterin converting factor small subunit
VIEVELYLYAYLRRYAPETQLGQPLCLRVEENTPVGQVLDRLGIPKEARQTVFVNGVSQAEGYVLAAGDRIAVFPAVAGGRGAGREAPGARPGSRPPASDGTAPVAREGGRRGPRRA